MAPRSPSRASGHARLTIPLAVLIALLAPAVALANGDLQGRDSAIAVSFLIVATPLAVGLYAQRSEPTRRFGRQLVLVGLGLFLTTFAYSDSNLLYTVGRIAGWCMEVALIYVLCAYPTGRLSGRAERATVAAGILLVALLYVPTIPFAEFPTPSPWGGCLDDCPVNAFDQASTSSAFVADVVQPLRNILASLVFLAAALVLARRMHRASPLARTSLAPVLGVAAVRFVAESGFLLLRGVGAPDAVLRPMGLAIALTVPLAALGFLLGLLQWRLRTARALEGLSGEMAGITDAASLQAVLRRCLEDPSLHLYLRDRDERGPWRSAGNGPVDGPLPKPGRFLCAIEGDGSTAALVSCDVAIRLQRPLLDGVRAAVASFLEHERLTGALQSTLAEIEASRTRIVAAADATRRQIERDLHDGTQQRLIALRIRLELIEDEIAEHPEQAQTMLHAIGPEVEAVISEVRDLSRGIYPPLLVDAGPTAALEGVAAALPVPTRVVGELPRRGNEIEAAVYFCCVEAIQNAIKHGEDLTEITVSLVDNGAVSFEVVDDGGGFIPGTSAGSGITNMRDRLAGVGGTLSLVFPNGGTRVRGTIPVSAPRRAAPGRVPGSLVGESASLSGPS